MNIDDNIKFIREEFPLLRKKVYLNCAAAGPPMRRVSEVMLDVWKRKLEGKRADRTPDTKAEVAKLISADPEEICWVNRVTQGINIVRSRGRRQYYCHRPCLSLEYLSMVPLHG